MEAWYKHSNTMRHIRLYESFEDPIDPLTREIFALTSEFTRTIRTLSWMWIKFTGPTEEEAAAREIVGRTKHNTPPQAGIADELAQIGWNVECSISIDRGFRLKGPYPNWEAAMMLTDEIRRDAEHDSESDRRMYDLTDDETNEAYFERLEEIVQDPETIERLEELGYTTEYEEE